MRYISRKHLLLSAVALLAVMAVLFTGYARGLGGQNQNSNKKAKDEEVTAEKATVRDGKKLKVRAGFEFVQEGKNKVSVRRFSTGLKATGGVSCFCEADAGGSAGAFCDARVSPDGKTTSCAEYGCTGCGIKFNK